MEGFGETISVDFEINKGTNVSFLLKKRSFVKKGNSVIS
jgi:hypothetical protein